jgi:hypothetical protein
MTRIVAVILVLALAACAASGPLFVEAPPPHAGEARVYVYRVSSLAIGGRDARFFVDGRRVFKLSSNGYSQFTVAPGKHELVQEWPFEVALGKTVRVPFEVQAGETKFFRFDVAAAIGGAAHFDLRWTLVEVPPDVARAEIADKNYQEPDEPEEAASASSR